jgi:murein DD-endopeptidase MepM/ murein hydrolase activator NlpD
VESLRVNDRYEYLATGGQDGKTFLWSLVTGRMVASLPHHADFVTAIDFTPNGQWIATGGFDRKILVTNISSLSQSYRLQGMGGAINDLKFISGHRLIAADKSGEIVVWDYFGARVVKRLKKMLDEAVSLCVTPDDRFLFAADRSGIVSLYDLTTYEMLSLRYLSYARPVTKIAYAKTGNHLIVGLETGEVTFNSPLKESAKMEELIDAGDLTEAYRIADENPLLRYSEAYVRLEALWEEAFEEAVRLLQNGMTDAARNVLEPFSGESSKRLLTQQLLHDYREFEKFRNAVEARRYPLAYSLAAQYPMLKQNPLYAKMEREWERLFAQAKKIVLQNGGEDRVREILKPFRGITGKSTLIQTLLAEKEIYKLFMKLVAKRDYKTALELAKRYPAIRELEEYRKVERIADVIAAKAEEELEAGRYAETARLATQLMEFPEKRELAEELKEKANLYASAMRYFAEKNYGAIYRMLEQYPYLEETQIVRRLEEAWQKVVRRAEEMAAKGDVAGLKKVFGPFLAIPQKRQKIEALFKQAYLEQLERLVGQGDEAVQKGVERYIRLFGLDDEMESWLRLHGIENRYMSIEPVEIEAIGPEELPERIL